MAVKTQKATDLPEGIDEALETVQNHTKDDEATWTKRIIEGGDLWTKISVGAGVILTAAREYAEDLRQVKVAFVLQGVEDRFIGWATSINKLSVSTVNAMIVSANVRMSAPEGSPLKELPYTFLTQLGRIPDDQRLDALVQAGGEMASLTSLTEKVDKIVEAAKPVQTAKARNDKIVKLSNKMSDDYKKATDGIDTVAGLAYAGQLLERGAFLQFEYKSDLVREAIKSLTSFAISDMSAKLATEAVEAEAV